MDIKNLVLSTFKQTVDQMEINSELKKSLKTHPKVEMFIQNLYTELMKAQVQRMKKGKGTFKKQTIVETTQAFTKTFVMGVNNEAEKRIMSDIEKLTIKKKEDHQKDLEASANGTLAGEFEELQNNVSFVERNQHG